MGRKVSYGFRHLSHTAVVLALACSGPPDSTNTGSSAPRGLPDEDSSLAAGSGGIPKIDVHLHVDLRSADLAIAILREHGIRLGLNAYGGIPGGGLEASAQLATQRKGALQPLCNVDFRSFGTAAFAPSTRAHLERCKALGARGVKISKYLGLGLRAPDGTLVPVDAPELDVLFESAGRLGLPVLIHSGDPRAFFEPPTAANERYEELRVHPGWSFHGTDPTGAAWPSWAALRAQHARRIARHPQTTFVAAHFGGAPEEPERVAALLDRHPNYYVDTAARVPELGRHSPARMRAFYTKYQDRILFGSDLGVGPGGLTLGSGGERPGTRAESRVFFERHFRYFESNARGIPHPTPIQGRWTIDAVGLPRPILEKIYYRNAVRVFGLQMPEA